MSASFLFFAEKICMHSPAQKWLRFSFLNLLLVATMGVILRYKILFSLPFVDQKHLLHGHSHFAFAGWVSQTLMVLLVQYLSTQTAIPVFKKYRPLLIANLVTAYGMLVAFPLQGYAFWSICFSTLSIFVSYTFAIFYLKDLGRIPGRQAAHPWLRFALLCNVVSSLGAFALAYMMASHTIHQNWYLLAVYFFLHFQYNGWFLFAGLGLLVSRLQQLPHFAKQSRLVFWLLAPACIPAYFLSALWLPLHPVVYGIVILSAALQLPAAWILFRTLLNPATQVKQVLSPAGRWLLVLSGIAYAIKLLLQAGSVHPALSQLAFGFRPIVIGYLHLVLLGVITIFLLGYIVSTKLIFLSATGRNGIRFFVTAIILNELALMVQGVAALGYHTVPYINHILLCAALLLFTGILLITISGNKQEPA